MYLYKMYKQQHAIQAQLVLNATHDQHILYWQNTAAPTKEVSKVEIIPVYFYCLFQCQAGLWNMFYLSVAVGFWVSRSGHNLSFGPNSKSMYLLNVTFLLLSLPKLWKGRGGMLGALTMELKLFVPIISNLWIITYLVLTPPSLTENSFWWQIVVWISENGMNVFYRWDIV